MVEISVCNILHTFLHYFSPSSKILKCTRLNIFVGHYLQMKEILEMEVQELVMRVGSQSTYLTFCQKILEVSKGLNPLFTEENGWSLVDLNKC